MGSSQADLRLSLLSGRDKVRYQDEADPLQNSFLMTTAEAISEQNAAKLDVLTLQVARVVQAVEGDVGLSSRLHTIERVLFGEDGVGGLVQEHKLLWKAHVWLLCTLSAGCGGGFTLLIQKLLKYL